jgi:hypothetical protein
MAQNIQLSIVPQHYIPALGFRSQNASVLLQHEWHIIPRAALQPLRAFISFQFEALAESAAEPLAGSQRQEA